MCACKGRHATLRPQAIRGCPPKLITTGSVNDKRRSRRPFTSRSAEKVERVLEVFARSLQKTTHHAAYECRLIRHTILSVLHRK